MKRLHIVPEVNEANGVYQVARDLAREDGGEVIDARQFQSTNLNNRTIEQFSEVWVHGMWLPREWKACWLALRFGKRLVRMTHGSLSPIYLERQGKWKKRLVAPIERWLFKRTDRVIVTCEEEKKWCQKWGLKNEFQMIDLKRFFRFQVSSSKFQVPSSKFQVSGERTLHVLYLGRRHPLKGVEFLERAVKEMGLEMNRRVLALRKIDECIGKDAFGGRTEVVTRLDEYGNAKANLGEVTVIVQHKRNKQTPPPKFRPLTEVVETVAKHQAAGFSPSTTVNSVANLIGPRKGAVREIGLGQGSRSTADVELRIVSDHFGEELEKDWAWCDVLVLPTLSENFGLVVAEALERGKRVITTDGAPAWEPPEAAEVKVRGEGEQWRDRIIYLKGFRDGTDEERVRLLKEAIRSLV